MDKGTIIVSFTVRCYREQPGGLLKVHTREVQSGEERYFSSLEAALRYMQRFLDKNG